MRTVNDDKIEVEVQMEKNAPTFSLIIKCLAIVERMCRVRRHSSLVTPFLWPIAALVHFKNETGIFNDYR